MSNHDVFAWTDIIHKVEARRDYLVKRERILIDHFAEVKALANKRADNKLIDIVDHCIMELSEVTK